ncbi:MAG TPA: hypothetical protein GX406_01970 [Pseudoclavibacter sp.]|nr:hypothetical protein [Pseudoclavibacter sp.]
MSLHDAPWPDGIGRPQPSHWFIEPVTPLSDAARSRLVENHRRVRELVAERFPGDAVLVSMLGLDADPVHAFDDAELARLRESF